MKEFKTLAGHFVVYNRLTDTCPEVDTIGDQATGPGNYHWGFKDGDQFRYGYETFEDAQDAMDSYVWAVVEGYGWP